MSDTEKTEKQGVNFCNTLFTDNDWKFRPQLDCDHGIDAFAETTEEGKPTGRHIAIQIKTGNSYFREKTDSGWIRRFEERHRKLWINHSLPVIVVIVNYSSKKAYWQEVCPETVEKAIKNFYVEIPKSQQLDKAGLESLRLLATVEKPKREIGLTGTGPNAAFETEDFQWLPAYTPDGVRHALYPKEGSTAVPSFQVAFDQGQEKLLRDFFEKGIGGDFRAKLVKSNFLPQSVRYPRQSRGLEIA